MKAALVLEGWSRYKIVVQCVVGEHGGQGVKVGARCFWDVNTDNFAQEMFLSENIFAVCAAFGVYYY